MGAEATSLGRIERIWMNLRPFDTDTMIRMCYKRMRMMMISMILCLDPPARRFDGNEDGEYKDLELVG